MSERLKDKIAIVVGAGQTAGDTIGNGRAISLLFAREGARVFLVDRSLQSAQETEAMILQEGGDACCLQADITAAADCQAVSDGCVSRFGSMGTFDVFRGCARECEGHFVKTGFLVSFVSEPTEFGEQESFVLVGRYPPVRKDVVELLGKFDETFTFGHPLNDPRLPGLTASEFMRASKSPQCIRQGSLSL